MKQKWDETPFDGGACRAPRDKWNFPEGVLALLGVKGHAIDIYIQKDAEEKYTLIVANAGLGSDLAQSHRVHDRTRPLMVWHGLPFQFITSVDLWAGLMEITSAIDIAADIPELPDNFLPKIDPEKFLPVELFYYHLLRVLGGRGRRLQWSGPEEPWNEDGNNYYARQQRTGTCAWR